ncbi:MAG TPA: nuclear transport factor 2 family protein [Solirubrobacteraceae bacterium]|jgi:hypothetical protein
MDAAQRTLEEVAIRHVIDMYFSAADSRDEGLWRTCFAPDAEFSHCPLGGPAEAAHVGGEAVARIFQTTRASIASHHLPCHVRIEIDGDEASAETYAVAFLLFAIDSGGQRITVRGLRYRDVLTRSSDGWLIRRRSHTSMWQFDTEGIPPALPEAVTSFLRT